jgi:uncharacterized membrane-anchored protein
MLHAPLPNGPNFFRSWVAIAALFIFAASATAQTQQRSPEEIRKEVNSLAWQSYPAVGLIGGRAEISLGTDLRFLDATNTNKFIQLAGNPPRPNSYLIAPRQTSWFAVFDFDSTGYIKDDDKIDPDELLKILKEQNVKGLEERKRLGLPLLHLTGWIVPPHYDMQTKRLEWGTRLASETGEPTVNYSIRILGRSGVMQAVLVSEPNDLEQDLRAFRAALKGFDFVQGERYAEFRAGDKVAEYGLAALIVGGAAAAAAKTGAGKALFKFVGIGLLAVGAVVIAFFKRIFSSKRNRPTSV